MAELVGLDGRMDGHHNEATGIERVAAGAGDMTLIEGPVIARRHLKHELVRRGRQFVVGRQCGQVRIVGRSAGHGRDDAVDDASQDQIQRGRAFTHQITKLSKMVSFSVVVVGISRSFSRKANSRSHHSCMVPARLLVTVSVRVSFPDHPTRPVNSATLGPPT